MIFQHTWEKVLSGEKTQTRRIVKPKPEWMRIGEQYVYDELDSGFQYVNENDEVVETPKIVTVYYTHGGWLNGDVAVEPDFYERTKWEVGKEYAVQPGRGKAAVGRIQITNIRHEDVRYISDADVRAEGFSSDYSFLLTWTKMHDKAAWRMNQTDMSDGDLVNGVYEPHSANWISYLRGHGTAATRSRYW
jgi:hypothetical protein